MAKLKNPEEYQHEEQINDTPIEPVEKIEVPPQDEKTTPIENIKPDENIQHEEYLKAEIQDLRQELEQEKIKETQRKKLIRVLLYLVIIAVGIFAVLLLIAKAALYDSIGSMLRHMWGELQLMGERIFR